VGRKTAERLVVELRDKLDFLTPAAAEPEAAPETRGRKPARVLQGSERYDDAVAALVTLGYAPSQAADVVQRVADEVPEANAQDLLRRSLAVLTRALVSR
jgi:Holliday junction resolvasome RuvABC DNA-binding subunit